MVSGYSYGSSIAYPHRTRCVRRHDNALLSIVVAEVHPANWRVLPPSPSAVAHKAEVMGLAKYQEFFYDFWF